MSYQSKSSEMVRCVESVRVHSLSPVVQSTHQLYCYAQRTIPIPTVWLTPLVSLVRIICDTCLPWPWRKFQKRSSYHKITSGNQLASTISTCTVPRMGPIHWERFKSL